MTPLPPLPPAVAPARPPQGGANPGRQDGGFADVLASVERAAPADNRPRDHVPAERSSPSSRETPGAAEKAAPADAAAAADAAGPAEAAPDGAGAADDTAGDTVDTPVVAEPVVIAATPAPVVLDPALAGGASPTVEGDAGADAVAAEVTVGPVIDEVEPDLLGEVEATEVTAGVDTPAPAVPTGPTEPIAIAQPQLDAATGHEVPTTAGPPPAMVDETVAPAVAPTEAAAAPLLADGDVVATVDAGDATAQPSAEAGDAPAAPTTGAHLAETVPAGTDGGPEVDLTTATDLPRSVSSAGASRPDGTQDQAPTVTFTPGGPATTPTAQAGPARPLTGMPAFAAAQVMSTPASQVASAVAALHRGADGVHEVSLEMHPAELGRVNVEVEIRAGIVNLRLSAEHDATRSLLNARLDDLRAALEQGGLQSGSMELSQHAFGRDGRDGDGPSRSTSTGLPGTAAPTATAVLTAPRQHHTATSVDLLV